MRDSACLALERPRRGGAAAYKTGLNQGNSQKLAAILGGEASIASPEANPRIFPEFREGR